MDLDGFWALIDRSAGHGPDPDDRAEWLTEQLEPLPVADIVDFQFHLENERSRAGSWHMWGAAWLICDGLCSDDGFFYFQSWLVGLGRAVFDSAVADPDNLAVLPQVQALAAIPSEDWPDEAWPDWESLDDAAEEAFDERAGADDDLQDLLEARGSTAASAPEPQDEEWDFEDRDECERRYPRLTALFGHPAAVSR